MERTQADIAVCNYFSTKSKVPKLYDHGFGNSVIQGTDIIDRYISAFYTGKAMGFNTVWNKLYQSSLIHEHSIAFDESRKKGEDGFFILLAALHTRRIAFTEEALCYYTSNTASLTHTFERGRMTASEYNIKEALELNESFFHLDIDFNAFYRNIIIHAIIIMSDAFILKRNDRWEVFDEFYHSAFFRGLIQYDRFAPLYAKALFNAIRANQRTLSGIFIKGIAVLRKLRHYNDRPEYREQNPEDRGT